MCDNQTIKELYTDSLEVEMPSKDFILGVFLRGAVSAKFTIPLPGEGNKNTYELDAETLSRVVFELGEKLEKDLPLTRREMLGFLSVARV